METVNGPLKGIFQYIDKNSEDFVNRLREAVAIRSVSAWLETRSDVVRMIEWAKERMEKLGIPCELIDLGRQELLRVDYPPLLLGHLKSAKATKTVCVYGHVDVQPADKKDGWSTEPFELTEKDGKLYGRGAADDKGPVLAWLNAVEAYQKTGIDIPVNIKFCFEGMEECGSEGLYDALEKLKTTWLADVDFVCISDSGWLGKSRPCLTYGLRGICYFCVEITCAANDLHSGVYGGCVYEATNDLIRLLSRLTDVDGRILIPGIYDSVAPFNDDERRLYDKIEFDVGACCREIGAVKFIHGENRCDTLAHTWRFPSLSIHGIEGAFGVEGSKTVIPRKVVGKFSIRTVPDQKSAEINRVVIDYLERTHSESGSPNRCHVLAHHSAEPWLSDWSHPHFEAGRRAVRTVFDCEPDLTRAGGTIPVTLMLQRCLAPGKNVMLVPLRAADDNAHSQNEKINRKNYIDGTKLLAAYLYEASKI